MAGGEMRLRLPRMTVQWLMLVVALVGTLVWAWRFQDENRNQNRAYISIQLRDYARGDTVGRRIAVENLGDAPAEEAERVAQVLIVAMDDPSAPVRRSAIRSYAQLFFHSGVLSTDLDRGATAILARFDDSDPEVRLQAVESLGQFQSYLPPGAPIATSPGSTIEVSTEQRAVALLARSLFDPDVRVRKAAIHSTWQTQRIAQVDPEPLFRVASLDREREVREQAIYMISVCWPSDSIVASFLRDRFEREPALVERGVALRAISTLNPPPVEFAPFLLTELERAKAEYPSYLVFSALIKMGRKAAFALPALAKRAHPPFGRFGTLGHWAATSIISIDPTSPEAQALLEPVVEEFLDPKNPEVNDAARLIEQYGPAAAPQLGTLRSGLISRDPMRRLATIRILGLMGKEAAPALPSLEAIAGHDLDAATRAVATRAVHSIREALNPSVDPAEE